MKKILAGILALSLSVCAFTSCGDKESSDEKTEKTSVSENKNVKGSDDEKSDDAEVSAESETSTADEEITTEEEPETEAETSKDDGEPSDVSTDDFPCKDSFETLFKSINAGDGNGIRSVCFTDEYLEALKNTDEEEYNSLISDFDAFNEELKELEQDAYEGYYEDDENAPDPSTVKLTFSCKVKEVNKLSYDDIQDYEEDLADDYEDVGLEPINIPEAYTVVFDLSIEYAGETLETDEDQEFTFYNIDGKWLLDYYEVF